MDKKKPLLGKFVSKVATACSKYEGTLQEVGEQVECESLDGNLTLAETSQFVDYVQSLVQEQIELIQFWRKGVLAALGECSETERSQILERFQSKVDWVM